MQSQLDAVGLKLQTAKSSEAMTSAMKGVTRAMVAMNRQMNIPQMQRIMQQFAMETEKMDMTTEMMEETIDGVMTEEGDEEEENLLVGKILDEIGISMTDSIPDAPLGTGPSTTAVGTGAKKAVTAGPAAGGGAKSGGKVSLPCACF